MPARRSEGVFPSQAYLPEPPAKVIWITFQKKCDPNHMALKPGHAEQPADAGCTLAEQITIKQSAKNLIPSTLRVRIDYIANLANKGVFMRTPAAARVKTPRRLVFGLIYQTDSTRTSRAEASLADYPSWQFHNISVA
jgi:hypothetical protein